MRLFQWIALIGALGPFVYYLLATYCSWDYFRQVRRAAPPDATFHPPISILKPVRGIDREAYENFASFCRLDYPDYEVVFAVSDLDDEVVPMIEKLRAEFPERSIRILTGAPTIGSNNKTNKLCQLAREAQYEHLVISDSDARVEADYLSEMIAPLARPEVGAVTALFRGMAGRGFFSRLDALAVPSESASSALLARKLEGQMKFAFGWSVATTKHHLAEIGGFEAFADYHSDDFELGNRIAAKGYRVELMRKSIWMVFPTETFREFLRHELRWSIGLRNVRKVGYLGLFFTFGLPWTVLAAIAAPSRELSAAYLLTYITLRILMAWTAGVWGLGDPVTRRSMWLVPVRDLTNFGVWLAGFFSNTIQWRGLAFRVKQGLLIPLATVEDVHAQTELIPRPMDRLGTQS
jgi:ceramide glucosyltransferase